MNEYNKIFTTLEYGQGYDRMVEMETLGQSMTQNYDCASTIGIRFLDYHLYQIKYNLKSNEYIQSLQLIFRNRNNNQLECLLDTDPSHDKEYEYTLEDDIDIKIVRYWLNNDRLTGFELTTNKKTGNIKMIGYQKNDVGKIPEFEGKKNIILGFGVNANDQYGISSFYCYYMDKRCYGINKHAGLIQLRAKIKQSAEYKKEIESKKDTFSPIEKLILNICDLPDTAFHPVISYIMSY